MTVSHWVDIGAVDDIPRRGARVVRASEVDIAVFRTADDRIMAVEDRCPHKKGPLSQGIVHGHSVTCPLHDWVIDLATGEAQGADVGCARVFDVKVEDGRLYLNFTALARRAA